MYSPKTADPDIWKIGGEPLEGSGFEAENPATGFESVQLSSEEGFNQ